MNIRAVTGNIDELRELLADLDELESSLQKRFNRQLFRRIRRLTGSQSEWAALANVSQATIGNWERGYTVPTKQYRYALRLATERVKQQVSQAFSDSQGVLGRRIDVIAANQSLNRSILRAALTDFDFDAINAKIIPIPFEGDFDEELLAEIAEDRANLLSSLSTQAEMIIESIGHTANLSEKKLLRVFEEYAKQCSDESPNPRLLNRLGTTIARIANTDDFRDAVNDVDIESVDGFNRDHLELMRLYFKEALAKAQEIDGAEVFADPSDIDGEEFKAVADIMERSTSDDGNRFIDSSIPTLLREISNEIRELNDSILLTADERRVAIFERRKFEAFKNGSVYVGRFVFFSALLASVAVPGVPEIMGALSLMVALAEGVAPGSIRSRYERLREKFQALPKLPEIDDQEQDKEK